MQVGLLGYPQVGKRTLLRLLTDISEESLLKAGAEPIPGICPVRDPRLEALTKMYDPKKTTPASTQYVLLPDLTKDSTKNRALFRHLEKADLIATVVRGFTDESIFHIDGAVDALRDLDAVLSELILHDLVFVETRLERIQAGPGRKGTQARPGEEVFLKRLLDCLNDDKPLRTLSFSVDEERLLSGACLMTRKPLLVVLNVDEDAVSKKDLINPINQRYGDCGVHCVPVSAKIEEELAQLTDDQEREAFLEELGLRESAIDRISRMGYEALGLISYFTVGADEVRAWTVRCGASAPEAGGVIHSDIERGFIRAEMMKYSDLMEQGDEQALAKAGKVHLKGKDYVVEDGDILNFRFNV